MIHQLKIKEEYFEDIRNGHKPYEIRKNDRGFSVGDYLALNEIDQDGDYTNRSLIVRVVNVFSDEEYCKEGYVTMTIVPCSLEAHGIGAYARPYTL